MSSNPNTYLTTLRNTLIINGELIADEFNTKGFTKYTKSGMYDTVQRFKSIASFEIKKIKNNPNIFTKDIFGLFDTFYKIMEDYPKPSMTNFEKFTGNPEIIKISHFLNYLILIRKFNQKYNQTNVNRNNNQFKIAFEKINKDFFNPLFNLRNEIILFDKDNYYKNKSYETIFNECFSEINKISSVISPRNNYSLAKSMILNQNKSLSSEKNKEARAYIYALLSVVNDLIPKMTRRQIPILVQDTKRKINKLLETKSIKVSNAELSNIINEILEAPKK